MIKRLKNNRSKTVGRKAKRRTKGNNRQSMNKSLNITAGGGLRRSYVRLKALTCLDQTRAKVNVS